jgi:hypothetical protein
MSVTFIDNMRRTQTYMKKKWLDAEAKYYDIIDDLTEKFDDKDVKNVPDLRFKTFQFLDDWEHGAMTSAEVLFILKSVNPTEVAHKQICRRLSNFMFENDVAADYIKGVLPELKEKICPLYESYLKMLTMYFQKLATVDAEQVPVTWLEVVVAKDDSFRTYIKDFTLNQIVNKLDTYYLKDLDNAYYHGKNLLMFEEDGEEGERTMHWLFAPHSYVERLKHIYQIDMELDLESCGNMTTVIQELAK